jgi:DNA-binding NarL/FixJ family response regulator
VRVVIAEDNVLLSEGLTLLLTRAGIEVVATVADGPAFVAAAAEHQPDIAIVDVRLPPSYRDEGVHAALAARRARPDLPILVLSQYVEMVYATELLAGDRGGIGYLLKDRVGRVEEFLDALRRVADGGTALDPEIVGRMLGRRRAAGPLDDLSPRELDVLREMAEGKSNRGIAEALVISEAAVEKHVTSIFRKLGIEGTATEHRRVLAVLRYVRAARR